MQTQVQAGDAISQAVARLKSQSQAGAVRENVRQQFAPNCSITRSVLDSAPSDVSAEALAECSSYDSVAGMHKAMLCARAVRVAYQMLQAASTVRCPALHLALTSTVSAVLRMLLCSKSAIVRRYHGCSVCLA